MRQRPEPIGLIVGIRADAVVEQIAVVVPSVRLTTHACQAIGDVVRVIGERAIVVLRQPVAHRVKCVADRRRVPTLLAPAPARSRRGLQLAFPISVGRCIDRLLQEPAALAHSR